MIQLQNVYLGNGLLLHYQHFWATFETCIMKDSGILLVSINSGLTPPSPGGPGGPAGPGSPGLPSLPFGPWGPCEAQMM